MMENIKLQYNIFFSVFLALIAVSCSNEAEPQIPDPDEGRETTVVDITLSLGDSWDIDFDETRAAPPSSSSDLNKNSYADIEDIESVKVFTFRRKEGSNGEFYRDIKNDKILTVDGTDESNHDKSNSHTHRTAKGSITKTYGYEYRVVAIAYPNKISSSFNSSSFAVSIGDEFLDDPDFWMSISGDTYSNFCAKLLANECSKWDDYLPGGVSANENDINPQILQTPQIFYGILHSENSKSNIISYAEIDTEGNLNSSVAITGILKRGVAKVTVNFSYINPNDGIQWITLLAETPNTKVELTEYDDFLTPSEPLSITYKDNLDWGKIKTKYTAVGYNTIGNSWGTVATPLNFYILAAKTKLAIRVKSSKNDYISTTIKLRNGQLKGNAVETHNNGTGIVSPDFDGETFYFRRNHKYTITISNPIEVVEKYPLN